MNTMTSDRGMTGGMMGMGGMGMMMMPGMMPGMMPQPGGMGMPMGGMGMGGMMMPRCRMTLQKMNNGMRMSCVCEDKTSALALQQMCMMMQGGLCGCSMTMNGMIVCCCNMAMAGCRMEMTEMGVDCVCTSGDAGAVKMMHACCDCMNAMMMPGCCMMMTMNGMPMCCMMA